ncbi:protein SNA4 [Kluyveromyces marxianus]|uniref:Protein SNA4 n=2 Tax=Kluyveromyces marxianus TaxID=4911 RepID=W0TI14_KLUMD|nr:protein SNA4 [Kluyveromyces marxianus DMKU3-1042]QGN17074.1 protein SNA4 [Kluyveromyces marxianus]BAO41769.1 protein SNA4 [Kluyveromyces marxianus DMKU3-1042]BAP73213.1 protein SNA4 [Kluyveromyces marxianus]
MCLCCVCCTVSDLLLYIVAIIFPPAAVGIRSGLYSSDLLLNALLTLFGFLPGMIHAFYYITVTSPLRLDTESRYYYQQGWTDAQRFGSPSAVTVVSQQPAPVEAPLLPPAQTSNPYHSIPRAGTPKGSPPPYSETV